MRHDEDEEDDVFDENGILKDGKTYHVPMRMMDSLQRSVRDHATRFRQVRIHDAPLHQPGFLRNPRNVAARRALYDALDAELQEAWRTPPSNGTRAPTEQPLQQKRIVTDERLAAYQEYDEWVQSRSTGDPVTTLERRIIAALREDVGSSEIAALITETEGAILRAEAAAQTERERSLDPIRSPDADAAREAAASAIFKTTRLKSLLPRLEACFSQVATTEYRAHWDTKFQALKSRRDELVEALCAYAQLAAQLEDLFRRVAALDIEISALHQSRPAGVPQHLHGAELKARGLSHFSTAAPSIATELRLPAWEPGAGAFWPPPQVPLAVLAAPTVPSYAGPNWFKGDKAKAAAERADAKRVARYYAREQREREDRENGRPLR